MKNVILYNKVTGEKKELPYMRMTLDEPIKSLAIDYEIYFIQENIVENPNPDRYTIKIMPIELTNSFHPEYKHLKICERNHVLVEIPQEEIIERLNYELGNYLDTEYPIAIRVKHSDELIIGTTQERENYIKALKNWLNECRSIRDAREYDYVNNNVFPEFSNYPVKP